MKMLEDYLAAVAAQLPEDQREDIVAELRDEILTRAESREEARGAPLSDDEFEALLREVGHPLVVAGRYGDGPKGLIGPELYPWWLFAMKVGLAAILVLSIVPPLLSALFGGGDIAYVIGHGIQSFIKSGLILLGGLTLAGWIIERQAKRPKFLTEWKVKDLAIFRTASGLDADKVKAWFQSGGYPAKREVQHKTTEQNLVAGALSSVIGTVILLCWWMGLFGWNLHGRLVPEGGQTFVSALFEIRDVVLLPVACYLVARLIFDVMRVILRSPVRFTAAGDLGLGLVRAGFLAWLWFASPLTSLISMQSVQEYVQLAVNGWHTDTLRTVVTMVISVGFVMEVWGLFVSAARLLTGRYRREG